MIIAFSSYLGSVESLKRGLQEKGIRSELTAIGDDPFLPENVLNPYQYFIEKYNQKVHNEKQLYYNFIDIPDFWEIRADGIYGGIYDLGEKKAAIYFTEPIERRNVQRVEWVMQNGWRYRIDYYNKYGLQYASEYLNVHGEVESKAYYSDSHQEVILEQPQNNIITLVECGKAKSMFTSRTLFLEYYFSLLEPEGQHVFFVTDEAEISGLVLEEGLWDYILFHKKIWLDKYCNLGGRKGHLLYYAPWKYPENNARAEALILTESDQIEGINYFVEELSCVRFHIAANTQVSDKLYSLTCYENVRVYPQISQRELDMLWEQCDFYLDINHYAEIYDAVSRAHQYNLLIMGFCNTLHNQELVADECIFSQQDYASFGMMLKTLLKHQEKRCLLLEKQHQKARDSWKRLLELLETTKVSGIVQIE